MTDPTTCTNCGAPVPAGAAFCTSCGTRVEAPAAAAPPPPPAPPAPPAADPTTVDGPSMADPTLVAGAAGAAAAAPPPPVAPPPAAPWSPPGAPAAPAAPPGPAAWAPPGGAAAPVAGPPPGTPAFGAPTAAPPMAGPPTAPAWGDPAAGAPPTAWGATAAPAAAPAKGPARSVAGGIAALLGGILTIAGVFSGWVTLGPDGNTVTDSAWSLTGGDGFLKSNDPYLLVGLAVIAIVLGLLLFVGVLRPLVRIGAIVIGIAIVATAALNWASISSFVTDNFASDFKASTAIGFYFVIVGGILTALAGLMPAKKS